MPSQEDRSLLEAALVGYTAQLAKIKTAIADLQKRLGNGTGRGLPAPVVRTTRRNKHFVSADEGRARIAEAQRKTWAAAKKQK